MADKITVTSIDGNRYDIDVEDLGKVYDGYHTIQELYDHRCELFIALCHMQSAFEAQIVGCNDDEENCWPWYSDRHSDGTMIPGWFIAGIGKTPGRQITYHLPLSLMPRFAGITKLEKAPHYDGHTSVDVLERLRSAYG